MSDPDDHADSGPSKSQLKREDAAMQALGERLAGLSKATIARFPASEVLRDALLESKRIRSHEARRRHLKRIGKLLREHDVDQIALAVDRLDPSSSMSMRATRAAERWCDRLLVEGRSALTEFIEKHPQVAAQRLRQLLREAGTAVTPGEITPAQRELMRLVRQQVIDRAAE